MEKKNNRRSDTNRNAVIKTRIDRTGKLRTETARRNVGFDIALSTDVHNNSTRLFIDLYGRDGSFPSSADMVLDGHQARTLYRTLHKHFSVKSWY